MTLSRQEVRRLLADNGIRPSKARGQNFVVDANTVRRIARLSGLGPGDRVLEIGAGVGSLTLALVETGATVTAVEIDRRLVTVLRDVVPEEVRVVEADAMQADWHALLGDEPSALVANLPYNIATPLVADLLDGVPNLTPMLVMVQREVGERLAARPGDAAYGAVSVKVAHWATAEVVGRVPRAVFFPIPTVDSVLVRIVRREVPVIASEGERAWFFRLVGAGFGQRRKMLRRSLAGLVEVDAFDLAGVRPEARPEELDVSAWARLAACTRSGLPPS
ncbi:MAG: 16S rRNA (adenine(1518)-N(6)/adenine(1519)-N(6))-dimethyltransferase RsmA [Acidimicrobiales bacterium]